MNIQDLQAKVRAAEEKVAKIEKTIEKHKARREKKILEVNKILEQNGISIKFEDIQDEDNVAHKYYGTTFHNEYYLAVCDVHSAESDIKGAEYKLRDAKEILKNWKEKLGREEAKIQYIQDTVPQIIKDFLEEWKRKCIDYYQKKANSYPEAYKQYQADLHRAYYDALKEIVDRLVAEDKEEFIKQYCWGKEQRFNEIMEMLEQYSPEGPQAYCQSYYKSYSEIFYFDYRSKNDPRNSRRYEDIKEAFNMRFGDMFFQAFKDQKFDKDWLDKQIEQEKNNKLIELMNRVTKITGTITDAKGLSVESTGDLNGVIIGERGKAKVQTIGAGGYNEHVILDSGRHGQRYHFRVLVNPIK